MSYALLRVSRARLLWGGQKKGWPAEPEGWGPGQGSGC